MAISSLKFRLSLGEGHILGLTALKRKAHANSEDAQTLAASLRH